MKKRFLREFRKQIRLAIDAAIGFIIAFTWKEHILGLVSVIFGDLNTVMPNLTSFFSALIVTLIGVVFIILSSKFLE